MKLVWLTIRLAFSRRICPHFDDRYCRCAPERRERLKTAIRARLAT